MNKEITKEEWMKNRMFITDPDDIADFWLSKLDQYADAKLERVVGQLESIFTALCDVDEYNRAFAERDLGKLIRRLRRELSGNKE